MRASIRNSAELGPDGGRIALILRRRRARLRAGRALQCPAPQKQGLRPVRPSGSRKSGLMKMPILAEFSRVRSPDKIRRRSPCRRANRHSGKGLPRACMIGKSLAIWRLGQGCCPNFRVNLGTAFAAPVISGRPHSSRKRCARTALSKARLVTTRAVAPRVSSDGNFRRVPRTPKLRPKWVKIDCL